MYDSAQRTTQRVKPGHHLLLVYLLKMASLTFVTRLRHCCANKATSLTPSKKRGLVYFRRSFEVTAVQIWCEYFPPKKEVWGCCCIVVEVVVVVVVLVVFRLNRSFYLTTSSVPPVHVLILHPREVQNYVVTDSETEENQNITANVLFNSVTH